jgi:hypothetical protein
VSVDQVLDALRIEVTNLKAAPEEKAAGSPPQPPPSAPEEAVTPASPPLTPPTEAIPVGSSVLMVKNKLKLFVDPGRLQDPGNPLAALQQEGW